MDTAVSADLVPELGNVLFGRPNAVGFVRIPRDWEDRFYQLLDAVSRITGGHPECLVFENKMFSLSPYDWEAECTCGFEEEVDGWLAQHEHKQECWCKRVDSRSRRLLRLSDKRLLLELKEMGWKRDSASGWAVWCDCGVADEFSRKFSGKDHKKDCRVNRPNFRFNPTGFEMKWYKYALRDTFANKSLSVQEFDSMIEQCIKSMEEGNGER